MGAKHSGFVRWVSRNAIWLTMLLTVLNPFLAVSATWATNSLQQSEQYRLSRDLETRQIIGLLAETRTYAQVLRSVLVLVAPYRAQAERHLDLDRIHGNIDAQLAAGRSFVDRANALMVTAGVDAKVLASGSLYAYEAALLNVQNIVDHTALYYADDDPDDRKVIAELIDAEREAANAALAQSDCHTVWKEAENFNSAANCWEQSKVFRDLQDAATQAAIKAEQALTALHK